MNAKGEELMIEKLSARVIAGIVAALIAVAVAWAAFHFYEKSRSQGAQARVDHEQSSAMMNSAADAVATVGADAARVTVSEELTRSNEAQIRAAPGADQRIDPRAHDAGIAALCRRAAYRNDPKCKETDR